MTVWLVSEVTYDYYRWDDVIHVCATLEKARERAEDRQKDFPYMFPEIVEDTDISAEMDSHEECHLLITEWTVEW